MNNIVALIIEHLEETLSIAIEASQRAHQTATDAENVPENKYDTLALEAAYLAHGQSKRIQDLQNSLQQYNHWSVPHYQRNSVVGLGALVSLEDNDEVLSHYFIGPSVGGLTIHSNDEKIIVLSPDAPLGALLMGRQYEDEVVFHFQGVRCDYTIVEIR